MKLFVWDMVESLRNYGAGEVIVMAKDLDQARQQVREQGSDAVASEIDSREPDAVFDKPHAVLIQGSD